MGNEESRIRVNEKCKSLHQKQIYNSNASEVQGSKRHCRMRSSRKRSKTSISRSWSRSPGKDRRFVSQSPKRSQRRLEMEEIDPDYYCKECDCYSSGQISWNQHIVGRRHAKNTRRESPEYYPSNAMKLIETEAKKRGYGYLPKEKLMKYDKRKDEFVGSKRFKLSSDARQNVTEIDQDNVGLDYILVVHKHGESVFQCFLCDPYTIYKNYQQLKDHVLGVNHQRAYKEEKHKSSIKIKRLKSRNPGKHSLEELVEPNLLSPNIAERISKKSIEIPRDGQLHKDSKSVRTNTLSTSTPNRLKRKSNFFRKTIEQVELYNRKYELKMTSTTFHPERNLSTPVSGTVSSRNSTNSRCSTASPGSGSTVSFSSCNDIASLDKGISSPELSEKSARTLCLLELVETLSIIDISKLFLLKLKNVEIQKEDLPFLDEVADKTAALSKKHLDSDLQKERTDEPFLEEAINLSTSGKRNSTSLKLSPTVHEESSAATLILDQPVQPPAEFWNTLPSTQDLENILSNLPSLNLSKNSDGVVEITLT